MDKLQVLLFLINFILEIITTFTNMIILTKYLIHIFDFFSNIIQFQDTDDHIPGLQCIWSVLHKYDREDSDCQLRSLHQNWNIISAYTVYDC